MELILPSLLSEIDGPALGDIVEQISKTDYLQHVIVGLDGPTATVTSGPTGSSAT